MNFLWKYFSIFLVGCSFYLPSTLTANEKQLELDRHFVILIRDTGLFYKKIGLRTNEFINKLEETLTDKGFSLTSNDRLSLAFYALHTEKKSVCNKKNGFSNLDNPKTYFEWIFINQAKQVKDIKKSLKSELNNTDCRGKGKTSNPLLTKYLLPVSLHKEKKSFPKFNQTIVIVADSDISIKGSSSVEESLLNVKKLENSVEGINIEDKNFNAAVNLISNVSNKNTYTQIGKTTLLGKIGIRSYNLEPDEKFVNENIKAHNPFNIYRQALANGSIVLKPNIEVSFKNTDEIKATAIEIYAKSKHPWVISGTTYPNTEASAHEFKLNNCKDCRKTAEKLYIPLLKLLGKDDSILTKNQVIPDNVILSYRIKYEYEYKDIYSAYIKYSDWHDLALTFEKPLVIEADDKLDKMPEYVLADISTQEKDDLKKLFASIELDNKEISKAKYQSGNNLIITQQQVAANIRSERSEKLNIYKEIESIKTSQRNKLYNLLWIGLTAVVIIVLIIFLFKKYYHRRFKPQLQWIPEENLTIDFNAPSSTLLLAGIIKFKDMGELPWFGKMFKHDTYPTEKVDLHLSGKLKESDTHLQLARGTLLGFVAPNYNIKKENKRLIKRLADQSVTGSLDIPIFINTELIKDFNHHKSDAVYKLQITDEHKLSMKMQWGRGQLKEVIQTIHFFLHIQPERAKLPHISFETATTEIEYEKKALTMGTYTFLSMAKHKFSVPYQNKWHINLRNNKGISCNNAVYFANGQSEEVNLILKSKSRINEMVFVDMTRANLPFPASCGDEYSLSLTGESTNQLLPNNINLIPNTKHTDLEITIKRNNDNALIFFEKEAIKFVPIDSNGKNRATETETVVDNTFPLKAELFMLENIDLDNKPLLEVTLRGKNLYEKTEIICEVDHQFIFNQDKDYIISHIEEENPHILLDSKNALEEMIKTPTSPEGDWDDMPVNAPNKLILNEKRTVKEFALKSSKKVTDYILKLDNARLGLKDKFLHIHPMDRKSGDRYSANDVNGDIKLQLELNIKIPNSKLKTINFIIPIGFYQPPSKYWHCIDFGTSAIVAAVGDRSKNNGPYETSYQAMLPLQNLGKAKEYYDYAQVDKQNDEISTTFLPSLVAADADLRLKVHDKPTTDLDAHPKGTPEYAAHNIQLGEAGFVSLPSGYWRGNPSFLARTIFSIKNHLSNNTEEYKFQTDIPTVIDEDGKESTYRRSVDIKKLVESTLSALAEGYLIKNDLIKKGSSLILTHPNTFTPAHSKRFVDIAYDAFKHPLGISSNEHIFLVSESDAAGFYYTQQRRANDNEYCNNPPKQEYILVYDFGAGTLDMSLIRADWEGDGGKHPKLWHVKNRLGVPLGGNYLDTLIAHSLHMILTENDHEILQLSETLSFKYAIPIVQQRQISQTKQESYTATMLNLWTDIKAAKVAWKNNKVFAIPLLPLKNIIAKIGVETNHLIQLQNIESLLPTSDDDKDTISNSEKHDRINQAQKKLIEKIQAKQQTDKICLAVEQHNNEDTLMLHIPSKKFLKLPLLKAYLDFVCNELVQELLSGGEVKREAINSLIITGRGALFGSSQQEESLIDKLITQFSDDSYVFFSNKGKYRKDIDPEIDYRKHDGLFTDVDAIAMKEAVTRGALEWQTFSPAARAKQVPLRLVLLWKNKFECLPLEENKQQLPLLIKEGDMNPLYIYLSSTLDLNRNDLRPSSKNYRRHLYSDVANYDSISEVFTAHNEKSAYIFIRQNEEHYGTAAIVFQSANGREEEKTLSQAMVDRGAIDAPWPVNGQPLKPNL